MHIYLNVGGTRFETTKETILNIPYFSAMYKMQGTIISTQENPIFLDRNPKAFLHILDLARNPSYNFPDKYYEELNFFGFDFEIVKEKNIISHNLPKSNINDFATKEYENSESNPLNIYINTNAQVTLHKGAYRKMTYFLDLPITEYFDTIPWTHKFRPDSAGNFYILIDSNYDIQHFTLHFGLKGNLQQDYIINYKFDLDICETFISGGYIWANLPINYKTIPKYCHLTELYFELTSDKYQNVKTALTWKSSKICTEERARIDTIIQEYLITKIQMIKFNNTNTVQIPDGSIIKLCWKIDQSIDYVNLINKNTNNKVTWLSGHFKCDKGEYFGEISPSRIAPTEGVCDSYLLSTGDYILEFPTLVAGKLWAFTYNVLVVANGLASLRYT